MSAAFFPGVKLYGLAADVVLFSSDAVYFHVNSQILMSRSSNAFGQLLATVAGRTTIDNDFTIPVPEHSHVLNVILHTIYDMPCAQFHPSNDVLAKAVMGLVKCGISLNTAIARDTPLYTVILSRVADAPLFFFTLAAEHDLDDLAVQISPHLLSRGQIVNIPDGFAQRIGPIYLHRLLTLHLSRGEALKRILRAPPRGHPQTADCDAEEQGKLVRAWTMTAAYLIWENRAGT